MEDKENEDAEDTENLRDLILRQLASVEASDISDEDSYQVRLSCILEDDESESSGGGVAVREFPKDMMNVDSTMNKKSEKGPPEEGDNLLGLQVAGNLYDSEGSDEFTMGHVQITDLDDVTLVDDEIKEKTDVGSDAEKGDLNSSEDGEDLTKSAGFAIKKLKSSDNVPKRPFVVRRRQLSSDSSDLDISMTNSAEAPSSDLKIIEINEVDDESTLNAPELPGLESEMSADEDLEPKVKEDHGIEVVDNETLSSIFAKVSKSYLEKTKAHIKWEENERIDGALVEPPRDRSKSREREPHGDHLSFQDVHIRGTSPREYNPPVPPETYLWEELKRLREKGGYPWTYLDKPPFDEATWKKYMENVYEPINPPPLSTDIQVPQQKENTKELLKEAPKGILKETSKEAPKVTLTEASKEVQKNASQEILTEASKEVQKEPSKDASEAAPDKISLPKGSSIPEINKQLSRVSSKNELKNEKDDAEDSKNSMDLDDESITAAQELQDKLEERFLAPEPQLAEAASTSSPHPSSSTTSTTAPKGEVTTNAGKTTQFEDIPIKRGSLGMNRREQMRAQAQEMQQKLRNQAGKIREKFSHIHRPGSSGKKEINASEEKSKFHLPRMSLPEMNFHLPEAPKFHFPDKSKFHLPERGKFNIAEKMHLPDKSKFHLPDKSKFHLPDKSIFHFPEKAKFHLPDRSKFHLPDRSKFHLPERPKFNFPNKAKFNLPQRAKINRPKLDIPKFRIPKNAQGTGETSGKKFDFKSYPKLFTRQSKDYTTSSPKHRRNGTPPPRMQELESTSKQGSREWTQKFDDMQYADEDLDEDMRETDSRRSGSFFEYRDKELNYTEEYDKDDNILRTISTKSSNSRLSEKELNYESSDDRKKGVLEEINSDEYFLRQKGISQDDIDMGKYLSREIREAFRSPGVNALAKMDYVGDENIHPNYQTEPTRPTRTTSANKKSALKKASTSDPSLPEDGYKTFPPRRPGRKSRSQSKSLLNEDATIPEQSPQYQAVEDDDLKYDNDNDVNLSRYDNVEDEDNISEYYKTPGPAKEYEHYKVPRSHAPLPSTTLNDESFNEENITKINTNEQLKEENTQKTPTPVARRKKNKKARLKAESSEETSAEKFKEVKDTIPQILPTESPVPPKRSRSSGSRSLRSFATDDEVNKSFQSEPCHFPSNKNLAVEDIVIGKDHRNFQLEHNHFSSDKSQIVEGMVIGENIIGFQSEPNHFSSDNLIVKDIIGGTTPCEFELRTERHNNEVTDLDDVGFGYATVGKPSPSKPERKKNEKPERPPPPRKKKEVPVTMYNTYPRSVPTRPLRNYSTLGPSRPPRHKKVRSVKEISIEKSTSPYSEITTKRLDESHVSDSNKDLQTEKVIEKMKGRPLPPPPRPPRQKSKGPEDEMDLTDNPEEYLWSMVKEEDIAFGRQAQPLFGESSQQPEHIEEACVSTQTDPLQEDFTFENEDGSDMMPEFSHEQLRIQEAFLEEMKKDEERKRQQKTSESDSIDVDLKVEVIRQIEDILSEERKELEERRKAESSQRKNEQKRNSLIDHKKAEAVTEETDIDMGYASLDRKAHRQELQPLVDETHTQEVTPSVSSKIEKLQIKELEAETINVHEVQAEQIFVKELQSNRVASQDIDNTGGNITLGNINLPSSFIDQVVARIPWDSLRQLGDQENSRPVRPQRRQRGAHQRDDSDEESALHSRKSHRRHHRPQNSSDEEDRRERRLLARNVEPVKGIPELSIQLARACTLASVQTLKTFVESNATIARTLDKEMCILLFLCIAIALVAGFFLFGFDAKIIHLHHWDFQFPPQPPPSGNL